MHTPDINSATENGQNFRESGVIHLSEARDFLIGKWFQVISIRQPWRNVFTIIESEKWEFAFKLASTPGVGERLKNEVSWNIELNKIPELSETTNSFVIPKIFESGEWNDLPYYISEYFPGAFINDRTPEDCEMLESWLERIVDCNLFFLSLQDDKLNFYRDRDFTTIAEYTDRGARRIESWAEDIPERDLSRIMEYITALKKGFVFGVNHGDFIPWHMIMQGEKFALIDGEHGSTKTLRYYDISYFYHRVYTVLRNPILAKKYLKILIDRLPQAEKELFEKQFPKVLASRIIGGYFDAKHDGTSYDIHDQLQEEFLSGSYM